MGEEEESHKSLHIFGRDVAQIPCFRSSFLYGIGGGFVSGLVAFMCTSRPKLSTNIGFGTFFCGTFVYWFSCRYRWSQKRFELSQLQRAMKEQSKYEGTAIEEALKNRSDSA